MSKSSSTNTQTHSYTYDALGRALTTSYPESGTKQFFYDVAPACAATTFYGQLVKTYDANGTTACYTYDSMNRVTSIVYSGANFDGNNKYFVYDSATVNNVAMVNTLGRLAEAYTAPTVAGTKVTDEGFSYTGRGEISDVYESTPNSGGYYHTSATYFANGAVSSLSGVTGGPWTYTIDGKGRPFSAVTGSINLVSSVTYNAADEPCVATLGLGDTDTYAYDNVTCSGLLATGRMSSYTFSVGATPVTEVGSLTWNANGSLRTLAIVDGFNAGGTQTCNYGTSSTAGYDEQGRLVSAVCANSSGTNVWGQSFSYDVFDNLSKSVPVGDTGLTWLPGYNQANNQYTLGGTSYDANGNLLNDTFHTYTWNQDNHPLTVSGGTSAAMVYDAFGREVEKLYGGTYKERLISPIGDLGLMSRANVSQVRTPLPGGLTYVTGNNFWHKDWLGSVRLISAHVRTVSSDNAFAPYGELYDNFGSGYVNFTGDNQDIVAGTFDTPNRELNANQGRWISPDPSHSSWNAYAYSTNPLGSIDPSGLLELTPFDNQGNVGAILGGVNSEFEAMNIPVVGGSQFGLLGYLNVNGPISPPSYVALIDNDGNVSYVPDSSDVDGTFLFSKIDVYGWYNPVMSSANSSSGPLSWLQSGLNYLKSHPVFISVNEILAGQITYQASTKTICANVGLGASVPPTKAVTVGVYNAGNMGNWTNVLSSWGYSFGANLGLGYQASTNSSGTIGGPTISGVGLSGSYTYGGCTTVP